MNVWEFMKRAEPHGRIVDAIAKTWDVLGRYNRPVVSISGGADSDIVLDMIHKLDYERKAVYVWFNTGLEYLATRRHLAYLETRYNIKIQRVSPIKPITQTVKEYGYPFLSKFVSSKLYELMHKGFDFNSGNSIDMDLKLFSGCWNGLKWWHNIGNFTAFNIRNNKSLKLFLTKYPPTFTISSRCCDFTKKLPSHHFIRAVNADLKILGLRKCEGGIRAATANCFTQGKHDDYAVFRPIFWFSDKDKVTYEERFGIKHSECYSIYGMQRTGCVGCPYNRRVFKDLQKVKDYEPGLVKLAYAVFGQVYDYTRMYYEFRTLHSGGTLPLFEEQEDFI